MRREFIKNKIKEALDGHDIDKMLNSIKNTNCDCCGYFDMDSISRYDGMEHPLYYMINKHKVDELVFISPKQYIYNIARGFGTSYEDAMGSAYDEEKAKKYAEEMKNGSKFPIGYYTENKAQQEGRHRAVAAMMLGCKQIPVIVKMEVSHGYIKNFVEKYQNLNKEELDKLFKEKGYHGISGLDWREFKKYVEYRL